MDRVTRKTLEQQVAILNAKNGGLLENNLELDYAEVYGGYCLVDKTYSIHLSPRSLTTLKGRGGGSVERNTLPNSFDQLRETIIYLWIAAYAAAILAMLSMAI